MDNKITRSLTKSKRLATLSLDRKKNTSFSQKDSLLWFHYGQQPWDLKRRVFYVISEFEKQFEQSVHSP